MDRMALRGKKIAVLGVGEAGRSAARYLHRQGAELTCCDRKAPENWPEDFRLWCENNKIGVLWEKDLPETGTSGLDMAVVSPGIPPRSPMVRFFTEQKVEVMGELALAASLWPGTLIGITGTNGKTTTTELTSHILTVAGIPCVKAGNISPPLFDLLEDSAGTDMAVLEISSFQLEYFPEKWPAWLKRPHFHTAAVLNLAPDHLDRHGSMERYSLCKARIFRFQRGDDLAILGPGTEKIQGNLPGKRLFLSLDDAEKTGASWNPEMAELRVLCPGRFDQVFDLSGWKLYGRHNMENLAAAVMAALNSGAEPAAVQKAVETFSPPDYRLQKSATFNGITFVNDSKATNVAALIAALNAIEGDVTLIAGGRGKGEDLGALSCFLQKENGNRPAARIKNAILIGEEAPRLKETLAPFVEGCHILVGRDGAETIKKAVQTAVTVSPPGFTVLLSPACASFDMFSSYKERGKAFDMAVRELK